MPDIPNPFSPLDHLFINKRNAKSSEPIKPWVDKLNPLKKFFSKKSGFSSASEISDPKSNKPSEFKNVPELLGKAKRAPFKVSWAMHADEIKEAQRLRYKVFAEEMGASLPANSEGLDVDEFDAYCDHLLVRDPETLRVIGTYRVLTPHKAVELGRLYSDSEFDLSRLNHLRPKMVEVGRSCVHQDYRSGAVIMALWSGLGQYMKQHDYEIMLGCASIPMADGGHYAASLYNSLSPEQMAPVENHAFPKLPLPLDRLNGGLDVEAPPLIKGYLKLGAKICSAPAWDPDFNTADLLTMLRLSEMNPRYAKHFLDKAD